MFVYPKHYDVIVVGAGHAGVEAALGSRRGWVAATLLLTINADTIGQMSCNPAIGGLAKGHLAREIDAMGGEMGKATDMTGLQFRMLNTKRGPSVWAPRAQCDKKAYQFRLKWICERQENLDLKQGQITKILHRDGVAFGVETTMEVQYHGTTVVVTTGTFLRGLMHIGQNQQAGGRAGEGAAMGLSGSLKELGLELGRLKTGTPPRLLRRSIDFSKTEIQPGDEPVPYFSYWKDDLFHVEHFGESPPTNPKSEIRNQQFPPTLPAQSWPASTANFPAILHTPLRPPRKLSAPTSISPPCIPAPSKVSAPAIVRPSKIRSSNSQKRSVSRFSSNRKASPPTKSMSTASPPASPSMFKWKWSARSSDAKTPKSCVPPTPSNTTLPSRPNSIHPWKPRSAAICSLPARSMEPPATKKPPPRV